MTGRGAHIDNSKVIVEFISHILVYVHTSFLKKNVLLGLIKKYTADNQSEKIFFGTI